MVQRKTQNTAFFPCKQCVIRVGGLRYKWGNNAPGRLAKPLGEKHIVTYQFSITNMNLKFFCRLDNST